MTGKTHRIIGIASGLTYMIASAKPEYSPATLGAVLVGSYFGSLLPDIDQPAAEIWNSLPFGHTLSNVVDPFFKHRNLSHSLIGIGLVYLGLHYLLLSFPTYWGINTHILLISSLIAYTSHLAADMLTEEGIPLFLPYHRMIGIPPRPFQGIRIKTGQWFENLVLFPLANLWLVFTIIVKWGIIRLIMLK